MNTKYKQINYSGLDMQNLLKLIEKRPIEWDQNDKNQVMVWLKQLKQFNLNWKKERRQENIQKCINEIEFQYFKKNEFVFHSYESCDYIYLLIDGSVSQLISKEEKEIEMEKDILIQIQHYQQLLKQKQQTDQIDHLNIDLYLQKINDLNLELEKDSRFEMARRIKQILHQSSFEYCNNQTYYFEHTFPDICVFKDVGQLTSGSLIGEYTGEELRNYSILTNSECYFFKIKIPLYFSIYKEEIKQKEKVRDFLRRLGLNQLIEQDIESISYYIERIKVNKDQIIHKQGDKSNQVIYLIKKGSFELRHQINPSIIEESPSKELQQTIEESDTSTIQTNFLNNQIKQQVINGDKLLKTNKLTQYMQEFKLFQVGEGEIFGNEELQSSISNITVVSKESKGVIYKIKMSTIKELIDKRIIQCIIDHGQNRMERINRRIQELFQFEQNKQQSPFRKLKKYTSLNTPQSLNEMNSYQSQDQLLKTPLNQQKNAAQNTLLISSFQDCIDSEITNTNNSTRKKNINLLRSHRFVKEGITPILSNYTPNYKSKRAKSILNSTLCKTQNTTVCMSPITSKNQQININLNLISNTETQTMTNSKLLGFNNINQLSNQQFSDYISNQLLNINHINEDNQKLVIENDKIQQQQLLIQQPLTAPQSPSKSLEKKMHEKMKQNNKLKDIMNPHQFFHKNQSFSQTQQQFKTQKQKNLQKSSGQPQIGLNNSQQQVQQNICKTDIQTITTAASNINNKDNPLQQSIIFSKMLKSRLTNFLDSQSQIQKKKEQEKNNQNFQQIVKQKQQSLNRLKHKNVNNLSYLKILEMNILKKKNCQSKTILTTNPSSFNSLPEDIHINHNINQNSQNIKQFQQGKGHSQTTNNSPSPQHQKNQNGIVYYQFQCQSPFIKTRAKSISIYKQSQDQRNLNKNLLQRNSSLIENKITANNIKQNNSSNPLNLSSCNSTKIFELNQRKSSYQMKVFNDDDNKINQLSNNFLIPYNNNQHNQEIHNQNNNIFSQQEKQFAQQLEFKCNMNSYQPKYKMQNSFNIGKYTHNQYLAPPNSKTDKFQSQQISFLDISPIKVRKQIKSSNALPSDQELEKNTIFASDPSKRSKKQFKSVMHQSFFVDSNNQSSLTNIN